VLLGGLQQHSWARLPALAIPVSIVRAIINRIDRHVFPREMMDHSFVDRLQDIDRQLFPGDSALIGDDNQQKTVPLQLPQGLGYPRKKFHLLPRCNVLAFRSFANNDSVTI
jgi:hypothetical protein